VAVDLIAAEIFEELPAQPWHGTLYRVMLGDYPADRENVVGARWNPPGVGAIYTSELAATAIAEVDYHLRQQSQPIRRDLKRTLYEIHVELGAVVDLAQSLSRLAKIGIDETKLMADDMQISQAIGKTITWLDRDGLRVPSMRAAGCNAVVYPSWAKEELYRFSVISQRAL
jgi:RES domain-containing protein